MFEVSPGVPRERGVPPPPPPARRAGLAKTAPAPPPAPAPMLAPPPPVAPPPPPVTAGDLQNLTVGTDRSDVLKLGPAASRITMFDDGHLVEVYRYATHDNTVGVVRVTDGAVSSIQMR